MTAMTEHVHGDDRDDPQIRHSGKDVRPMVNHEVNSDPSDGQREDDPHRCWNPRCPISRFPRLFGFGAGVVMVRKLDTHEAAPGVSRKLLRIPKVASVIAIDAAASGARPVSARMASIVSGTTMASLKTW